MGKEKIKKIIAAVLIAMFAVMMVPIQAKASVMLNAKTKTMSIGEKATLRVYGATSKVKWSSSNKKVATVTQGGKVTAKNAGTATIKAKVSKKTLKCKITVKKPAKTYESKVVYEDENAIITFTGISGDEGNYRIDLMVENLSKRDLVIQVEDFSINGFMVDPICSMEISSGKKIKDGIKVWDVLGDVTPMSEVSAIETKFRVFDWEDFDFGYTTETISILE